MIDSKMREFVQSYINIDTKINDLWSLCSILKSTYGNDAGKINIRDLFRLAVEPKPVELPVPRQPIGLGDVKFSPDTVDNIIRDRERKAEKKPPAEPGVLSGHKCNKPWCGTCQPSSVIDFEGSSEAHEAKCGALLLRVIFNDLGDRIFVVGDIIAKKDRIYEAFQHAGISMECIIKIWAPVNIGLALHDLVGKPIHGLVLEVTKDRQRASHYCIRRVTEEKENVRTWPEVPSEEKFPKSLPPLKNRRMNALESNQCLRVLWDRRKLHPNGYDLDTARKVLNKQDMTCYEWKEVCEKKIRSKTIPGMKYMLVTVGSSENDGRCVAKAFREIV